LKRGQLFHPFHPVLGLPEIVLQVVWISLLGYHLAESCYLSINENADPDVRVDMETIFNRLVPENRPEYEHTLEGADDMPAHAKSILSGVSITIPITDGRLNLGTWQGIYFCEYRNYGGSRELVVTIIGE